MTPTLPLNPFDPAATLKQVYATMGEAFAAIPDGHTHAILIDGTWSQHGGPPGALVSFVQKAPAGWNVVIDGGWDGDHGAQAGVQLAKSW